MFFFLGLLPMFFCPSFVYLERERESEREGQREHSIREALSWHDRWSGMLSVRHAICDGKHHYRPVRRTDQRHIRAANASLAAREQWSLRPRAFENPLAEE